MSFCGCFYITVAMCGLVLTGMDLNTGLRMNGQMVGMGACIMLFVCVGVSAVMPVRRVGMLQPIELMEGDDSYDTVKSDKKDFGKRRSKGRPF